jgi:hypothetical protein
MGYEYTEDTQSTEQDESDVWFSYILERPLTLHGTTYESLAFKEPMASHALNAFPGGLQEGFKISDILRFMSKICLNKLAPNEISKINSRDVKNCSTQIIDKLGLNDADSTEILPSDEPYYLSKPIFINGEECTFVSFKEATGDDLVAFEELKGSDLNRVIKGIERLNEQGLTRKIIAEHITFFDFYRLSVVMGKVVSGESEDT